MGWPWKRRAVRTAARAECPSCACGVVVRMLRAWHVGGDGQAVHADEAGDVVRCCQCATVYTVLASGAVLHAKGSQADRQTAAQQQGGTRGGRRQVGYGLDSDLETLSADSDLPL